MKKLVYSCFITFWAVIGTLLAVDTLSPGGAAAGEQALPEYTLQDVAEHAGLESCWMAIEGKVYDFTGYIPEHPTPPSVMAPWCGRKATEGMRTKGYGRDHSPRAWAMMDNYLIGTLAGGTP